MSIRWNKGLCALFAFACLLGGCASTASSPYRFVNSYAAPDGGWDFVRLDEVKRRLYVARTNGVTVLDLKTGVVTGKLVDGARTHIALPINNGDEVFVTNGGDSSAFIADAMTGDVRVRGIATGRKPDGALLEPMTGLVWVLDNAGDGIVLVDPSNGAVAGRIDTGGALESAAVDGKGAVWVTVEDRSEILVLDARSRKVVAHWPLDGCEEPSGLAFDPRSVRLVAECANGKAEIVSAKDGAWIGDVPIGARPDALAYDGRRHLMLAPTGGDGIIHVIDPARARVVAHLQGYKGSRHLAIDPRTGALYLPAADFNPAVGEGRPTMQPGSFRILRLER